MKNELADAVGRFGVLNMDNATRLWLLSITFLCGCRTQPHHVDPVPARTDPRMGAIVARFRARIPKLMKKHRIPGLALALVDRRGILWTEGFGATDESNPSPVTPDTPFSLQSTSKTVTTVAVLVAAQRGLVELDRPLARYLPGFLVPSRFESQPLQKMTLRHLLSHTAGLTHEAPIGNNFEPCDCFTEHWRSIAQTWLRYPVGDRYAYSNLGVDLAGAVLEQVSGKRFATFVDEVLLRPLGMSNSTFDLERIRAQRDRAVGHSRGFKRVPLEIPMVPSGGLYASARDMARFLLFQLNRGRPFPTARPLLEGRWLQEMQRIPFPKEGQREGYALGIVRGTRNGLPLLNHGGGGFGFICDLMWYPEQGVGLVILTNSSDHPLQGELAHRILDTFLGSPPRPANTATKSSSESSMSLAAASPFVGSYLGRAGRVDLVIQPKGAALSSRGQVIPLCFVSTDVAVDDKSRHYRFVRQKDGRPLMMLRVEDGVAFDYNDGPLDPPGPNRAEWERYLGKYRVRVWGKPVAIMHLQRKNGYLYLDDVRLVEHSRGLFFSSDGESLDLNANPPRARSIRIERVSEQQPVK